MQRVTRTLEKVLETKNTLDDGKAQKLREGYKWYKTDRKQKSSLDKVIDVIQAEEVGLGSFAETLLAHVTTRMDVVLERIEPARDVNSFAVRERAFAKLIVDLASPYKVEFRGWLV